MPWESGELDWSWLLAHASVCGLVLARVLGLCLTAPGLAIPELDWRFRIGLAAALAMILIPVVEPSIVAPVRWQGVASALFLELLAGAVLGYLAATIVAGAAWPASWWLRRRGSRPRRCSTRRPARKSARSAGSTAGSPWSRFWVSAAR